MSSSRRPRRSPGSASITRICRRASIANTRHTAKRMAEDGRTMIVTGASSGIGHALALLAARRRFRVVAVARRAGRLDALAGSIRTEGGSCTTVAGDVTARDMPARVVEAALRDFGRIDVVVNNAG